ncbi:l-type lectin-domain containing receptor kinase ix.1 [Quercus suber]|uniref:L-type lectin-domain containing receptor kinase ix.1 n=1 Tax=Quercus suber TaxID=58331 RepID=A0AAW0JX91_QUESU
MEVLPERVTVGFSAATGVRIERNSIQSWEFSSSLDIKETTRKEAEYISLIVELAVVGMIIIVFVMLWIWKGNKMVTAEIVNVTSIHDDLEQGAGPRRFSCRDLWEQCVGHRDIKSSNVMLDSNFNVKLAGPQTTRLAGTLGYLAPEYISTGRASKESDVFSFGVVALEIAKGRRSSNLMGPNSVMGLVEWIWSLHGRGDLLLAVDRKLKTDFDEKQIECLMIVWTLAWFPDYQIREKITKADCSTKFWAL